jgi:hypothetical protein
MRSRLRALTARRTALQAECALQRDDIGLVYGHIEDRVGRVDRVVETLRGLTPILAAGGVILLVALGPGRSLRLMQRGLALGVSVNQIRRFLR